MSLLRRVLRVGLSVMAACGRLERPPPDRPIEPTLTVAPDPGAPTSGRRVVAVGQIAQPWHTGAWSPASITLSDVAAGDAIVVLGAYWGDLVAFSNTWATDGRRKLQAVVDQGPAIVGRKKPPVFAQLWVDLDPAPGPHVIVPPYLGGPAGDGTLYVAQVRGLTERRLIARGETRANGTALPGVSVALDGSAAAGDLVIAIAGYDNTQPRDRPGWSHPPAGWIALGVQDDASNNVPSEVSYRVVAEPGAQSVSWTWADTTVNITVAAIAALR